LLLGNEAMALGLLENGCSVATSYPGTPASEILASAASLKKIHGLSLHVQWAVNEKIAFEIAYAAAIAGLRTAVSMKQVGLNVASDPLMSAAYMGTKGGFILISADDPGPHSSQTEQDSRLMAVMAKIPVLDPDSPSQARYMAALGYEMSEAFEIPVMIRPTTRVCHSRQDIAVGPISVEPRTADFERNPVRWAATPKFRHQLHRQLEEKLDAVSHYAKTTPVCLNSGKRFSRALVVSGVAAAHTREIVEEMGLWGTLSVYQVLQPFPLHADFISELLSHHDDILVIEESTGVIEMQLADRYRVKGRNSRAVPRVGELLPEDVERLISEFAGLPVKTVLIPAPSPGRRPTLCAGCPHRASFYAIKRAVRKGIYTSDIGCYTLGLNLGVVDTVLCMGAAISQAAGFYHAYRDMEKRPDIVATMGDSTFFHAGIPALIDAVVQQVRFLLVILDNRTTAMTGSQPTPSTGVGVCGEPLNSVDIEAVVRACGVQYCETGNPYQLKAFIPLLKEAVAYSRDSGPAVVISRYPCILDRRSRNERTPGISVAVNDRCDGCAHCVEQFECPALILDTTVHRVHIDPMVCVGCGVCIHVCPKGAIEEVE